MRILSRSFLRDEEGAVVALAALSIPIMMLAIGAAVDYSRAGALKTRLQDAADAAVLVAAKSASSRNWLCRDSASESRTGRRCPSNSHWRSSTQRSRRA